jgi:hypothetical protein
MKPISHLSTMLTSASSSSPGGAPSASPSPSSSELSPGMHAGSALELPSAGVPCLGCSSPHIVSHVSTVGARRCARPGQSAAHGGMLDLSALSDLVRCSQRGTLSSLCSMNNAGRVIH